MSFEFVIIILSLLLSAFFSGMEIAYISANKIHIELEKKQNTFISKILTKLTAKPSKFIATMLIGNNIALVVYGFFMGDALVNWFQSFLPSQNLFIEYMLTDLSLFTQTVISTLIILITAEFLPKVFFQIYSNSMIKILSVPAYVFYMFFTFVSDFVIWVSDIVLKKFFKTDGDEVQLAFSKIELGNYISEQMETVEEHDEVDAEIQIFQNALEFSEVKSREIMVPRTEIIGVEIGESVKVLNDLFSSTGLSKILVYKENMDNVVGYVHSFELFKKPKLIKSIIVPVEFVPETMLANDVLNALIRKRKSIAIVLDEYGGTSGLVTVEDIVEELFGEIEDEHDTVELIEERLDQDHYKLSARLEVDYLNDTYKLSLPEDENFETLSGLIIAHTEEIPQQNDQVVIGKYQFTILEVSNTKIDLVELKVLDQD